MKKFHFLISLFFLSIVFENCGGGKSSGAFPMEKKYWTPDDYETVNEELTSLKYNNKELPNLDNRNTAPVFKKIVDTINFSIVANDNQLGLEHRKEFTSKLFEQYRQLVDAYRGTDRSDKYQYPLELVEIEKFGLALQIYYIETSNQSIIKSADDPNEAQVVDVVKKNKNILINNYSLYLEHINYEDRFTDRALISYSDGLNDFFPRLINDVAPDGDYSDMLIKIDNMLKKTKNALITAQLQNIQSLIKSKAPKT
ncbi:MAG: hypothetical protein ACHQF0_14130 [Chitinophagales bacterium]